MQFAIRIPAIRKTLCAALLAAVAANAQADVVTDWNARAGNIVVDSKLGTPPAIRVMAIVQVAVHEAVAAAQREPAPGVSLDAAIAAANRATLAKLVPVQQPAIDAAYQSALAALPDGPAKAAGIAVGERAAAATLALPADDGAATAESYRPLTAPGAYVPTGTPAVPQWPQRKPWLMTRADQFRPGPPPALASERWARDYDEVKALGSRNSTRRSAAETEVARFWEYSLPPIYFGVVRSVADQPGRDVARNARLYATVAMAMDDALIAVFDAKYHYGFWRPATAIRNGDRDGNDATERDAAWTPLIDAPLHPEYPSAHSILAAAVGTVLQADVAGAPLPALTTTSPTAKGAARRWTSVDAFVEEVAFARVLEGIHYRFSSETGVAMGREVGALAVTRVLRGDDVALPAALVAPNERHVERIAAAGVQVYECRAKPGAAGAFEWAFIAPEALLRDGNGAAVGRHYAGPHWEAPDGSRIVGSVKARADAPQANAIPWLLLATQSVGGAGRFAGVTSVQRINTVGGTAPARGCDAATVGTVERVPYTADYVLLAPVVH